MSPPSPVAGGCARLSSRELRRGASPPPSEAGRRVSGVHTDRPSLDQRPAGDLRTRPPPPRALRRLRPRADGDVARVPPVAAADRERASGASRAWTETSEPRPKCGAAASPWPSAVRLRVLNSPPSSGGRRGD